ncbi:zinc finger (C2H2 type) family protein [Tasmannia lanceolata]|uniref:zinc finger (C2H2 type) family protein n=1 Tax=Tasmannia lanceolata TaxID=3420 RepID=UPI00406448AF
MANMRSFFNHFISLFLLLFHLGCFLFTPNNKLPSPKKKQNLYSPRSKSNKPFTLIKDPFSYLKPIFSFKKPKKQTLTQTQIHHEEQPFPSSSRSTLRSFGSCDRILSTPQRKSPSGFEPDTSFEPPPKRSSFRNDIFPCPICGEVFYKTLVFEQHQSTKHAVSELYDGDSSKNIVGIIFQSGWKNRFPTINRILKIHNSPKILARFEEYRESIKSKASRNGGKKNERCIADGNELLRFHCSTFLCSLGQNGNSAICSHEYCNICWIIRSGFSPKLDGILTQGSSWRAHVAIPEGMEEEFGFMNVKRAMLVCRVVAGRIARERGVDSVDKEDPGFDSVVVVGNGGTHQTWLDEELLVFSPSAVLPCFVIIYSV